MAAGQKAVIDESDVEGGDGSLEMALVAWTSRHGPVIYNKWQSAYFLLIRDWEFEDEKAPVGEDPTARQRRMLEYDDQMQTDMFGPDHRIQAAKRQRNTNASNQQGGGGFTPNLQVAVRPDERPENYTVYTPKQLEVELDLQADDVSPDRLLAAPEGRGEEHSNDRRGHQFRHRGNVNAFCHLLQVTAS